MDFLERLGILLRTKDDLIVAVCMLGDVDQSKLVRHVLLFKTFGCCYIFKPNVKFHRKVKE